ncbi:MAG: phage portal protein [Hyphomicrobium sp.]|uniref:phage portal protein n=1 Tax=Hyphomicrobium sp. TaxID=82 RepID=UPI003D0C5447
MQAQATRPVARRMPVHEVLASRMMRAGGSPYTAAAQFDRQFSGWQPALRSVDAEILRDHAKARARARDLYRNHPYGKQIVRMATLAQVGKRLRYASKVDYEFLGIDEEEADRWGAQFDRVWDAYAHGPGAQIDAARKRNFSAMMRLAVSIRMIDGEVLCGAEWDERRRWKTCFKLVDIDRLSNPHGKPDSPFLRAGVALDEHQAPVGYYIRNGHPADISLLDAARANTWSFHMRETAWGRPVMMHSFLAERAEQTRGITEFTTVIRSMKMQQEFSEADLASAIMQAMHALVIKSSADWAQAIQSLGAEIDVDENGDPVNPMQAATLDQLATAAGYYGEARITGFDGGRIAHLVPGDELQFVSPGNKGSSAAEFTKSAVKEFSAGLGGDPISVSQDYSEVNYSSARMSVATNWRVHEVSRGELVYDLGMPMVQCFMEEAVHSGALALPKGIKPFEFYDALPALCKGVFMTWGPPMLDPTKERAGQLAGWNLGLDTLEELGAEEGDDWRAKIRQKGREIAFMREYGVPLPGEPVMPPMAAEPDAGKGKKKPEEKTDG